MGKTIYTSKNLLRELLDDLSSDALLTSTVVDPESARDTLRDIAVMSTALHESLNDQSELTQQQLQLINSAKDTLDAVIRQLAPHALRDMNTMANEHFEWCEDPAGSYAKYLVKSTNNLGRVKRRSG